MRPSVSNSDLVRFVLVGGGVIVLALLAWHLSDVLLLVFGAVLIATVLRSLGDVITRYTKLRHPFSMGLGGLLLVLIAAVFVMLLGTQIWAQLQNLSEKAPELIGGAGKQLGIANLSDRIAESLKSFFTRSSLVGDIAGYTTGILGGVSEAVLVIAAGVYLGLSPETYRDGVLLLVPRQRREEVGSALNNAGNALRFWLAGQLAVMAMVGVSTGVGLWLVGMPSALGLGFIAGVLEFIPFVGPILAAIPSLVLALSVGGNMVWYVLVIYLIIQQAENNLIIPLVQRKTVELPPVLGMFAIVALGIVFGPMGVVLGVPLTVVLLVMVKQLYVRETLGEATSVPGEGPVAMVPAAELSVAAGSSLDPAVTGSPSGHAIGSAVIVNRHST